MFEAFYKRTLRTYGIIKLLKARVIVLTAFSFTCSHGLSQVSDSAFKVFSVSGYIKDLPYLQFVNNQESSFNNIQNLRLNFDVKFSKSTRLALEMRNRIMFGDAGWGESQMVASLKHDHGWLNLGTAASLGGTDGVVHLMADRLFLEHNAGKWQIRAGRQRINWGVNMVSNPNDLFNTYSFFDFDYPERPGSDAIRVQYYRNEMSHVEAAFAPADHISDAVGAFLYSTNYKGFDVQFIGGFYHNRLALGGGWAGHISGAGFKVESTFFNSLDGSGKSDLVTSASTDYIFQNGLYIFLEGLYNGGFEAAEMQELNLLKPLSADNIMFSTYAVTTSASYPFSPVLNGSLALMLLPDIHSFFISPSLSYSVMTNFDVSLISQIYGSTGNAANGGGAVALIGSLQWSF